MIGRLWTWALGKSDIIDSSTRVLAATSAPAADADHDGAVSCDELRAFVDIVPGSALIVGGACDGPPR